MQSEETKQNEGTPEQPYSAATHIRSSWNWSLDKIRERTAHYSQEDQELLIGLFRWCIDDQHPMHIADAARRIDCSENLLYQIYTGIYRTPDKVEKDGAGKPIESTRIRGELRQPSRELMKNIRSFLTTEQKRFDGGQNEFVITPTYETIATSCDLARESQTPVIIWGPSHIGKTWSLRRYQQTNNHGRTFMCELDAACGMGGMVRSIAKACSISDKSNTAALIERIKRALSPNTLLIIDEMHLLRHTYRLNSFFACVEVIRRIYDAARCGMVLSWTNVDNLRNSSQGELTQLWRRGVHKVALPEMPTKGDLKKIFEHYGMTFPDKDLKIEISATLIEKPYDILKQLALKDGLLAITERMRYARKISGKKKEVVNWGHFVEAHLIIEKQAIAVPNWS